MIAVFGAMTNNCRLSGFVAICRLGRISQKVGCVYHLGHPHLTSFLCTSMLVHLAWPLFFLYCMLALVATYTRNYDLHRWLYPYTKPTPMLLLLTWTAHFISISPTGTERTLAVVALLSQFDAVIDVSTPLLFAIVLGMVSVLSIHSFQVFTVSS